MFIKHICAIWQKLQSQNGNDGHLSRETVHCQHPRNLHVTLSKHNRTFYPRGNRILTYVITICLLCIIPLLSMFASINDIVVSFFLFWDFILMKSYWMYSFCCIFFCYILFSESHSYDCRKLQLIFIAILLSAVTLHPQLKLSLIDSDWVVLQFCV